MAGRGCPFIPYLLPIYPLAQRCKARPHSGATQLKRSLARVTPVGAPACYTLSESEALAFLGLKIGIPRSLRIFSTHLLETPNFSATE